MTDSGHFVITWTSTGQDGSDDGVYAQAYDGEGNPLGTEFRVNTNTQSAQRYASVSSNDSGEFVVVWSSYNQDGSNDGVFAQRYVLASSDVELVATIDNPLSEDVVIPLTYTGTAIPDVDFEQVGQPGVAPTQIVIPAGQTSGSVTIRNVADVLDEDVESLSIHFGVPSNASLASADPIEIQLLDDDPEPAVFLTSAGQTLDEQDLSLPVTVSLSEVSGRDVTVNLSTSGTATLGMDYTFDNPVVVIPAGQLSAGTVLQLLDDTVGEGAEQIQVQIDSADYATVPATPGQPASLTHLINLNDTPTMQFASVLRQVSETDGTYNVLLTLSNESTSPITTTITLSGDATIGDDYTSALGTTFDVTFDPGETEKTISVSLVNDETQEADKSLLFQTTNLFGSTITHQARIIDDDSTFVTVTTSPATVWEDTGLVTITATLSKAYDVGSGIDVLVPISFSSDLQNGVEFFADTNPIVIPAGATTATRGIALVDNDTPGSDEVITINLGTPDHARLLSNDNLSIVIREDDPRVSFNGFGQTASAKTISVSETAGTVKIPVFLNRRVNNAISIPVSVYSTQMDSSEYNLVSATLQINAGFDRGYVEIDIIDDGTFDGTESLTVKLDTGAGFTLEPTSSDRTRTVKVNDNEGAPVAEWLHYRVTASESVGSFNTKLKLSHASDSPVDVVVLVEKSVISPTKDLSVNGFSLSSSARFFYKTYRYSKTYTFAAYQTEIPIEIKRIDDSTFEKTETFTFKAIVAGTTTDTFDFVILDNDVQTTTASSSGGGSGSSGGGGNWYDDFVNIPDPRDSVPSGLSWKTVFGGDGFADGATAFFDANFNQVPDFVDANGNGVLDEGELVEPIAESNYDGSVAIPSLVDFDLNQDGVIDSMEGQIVFRGGVDSSTGQPFLVPLVTPIAYPVASPLSTLVSAIQESQGLDVLSAEAVAANALSIPEQAYLRSHLIPLTNSGDAVAAQSFAASAMIYGTASQMAAFISGLQGGVPTDLAGRLVFAEMAALLTEPDALLDLTEPVVIDSILRGAIARSGATLPAGDELSTAVDVIVAINEQFAAIPVEGTREYLESVAHIQVVANGQSPADLILLANGTVSSATIQSTYLGAGLQQQIANSEILNVVVPYVLTSNAQIIEGDSGTSLLQVDVSLSDASNLPVTVNYATQDYTAVAGEDYDSIAGQLSWAAGETTTHTLQIPILGDTEFEADEQFHLAFTDAVNAAVLETLSTLSIHNDDLASFTIESPAGDLDYLIESDSSGILIEESGEALFGGTLVETPLLTLEGSAGVRNDFTFRAGLDAVSPVDGFRVVGAGPDDTLTIDAQFAESLQHIITGSGTGRFLVNGVTLSYENIATINSPASPIFTLLPTTPLELGDSPMFAIDVPGFDSELPSETIWTITHDEMVIATGMGQAATIPDLELGTYRIDFLATQEGRLTTGISYEFEVRPAPVVIGTAVNGGDNNRSGIRELTFTFDQAVTLGSPTALNLFNHSTGLPVDLSGAVLVNNGTTAVTWVLHDGPGGMTDVVLADGRYTAELPAGATTPNLAQTHTFAFHKLAGDIDGDGAVNFNDTVPLSLSFGVTGGPIFGPGDGDGDGDVNFNDTVPLSLNFGATLAALTLDLGDAPDSATFPTTLANDGARHVITGNTLFLGTTRDAETNGQPNATATGDDIAGMADEDGVVISGGSLLFGTPVNVTVTASVPSSAVINGWVDFNGDGDWDDAGEHVFVDVAIVHGANPLSITAPGSSVASPIARFRLTETAGYSYFGLAPNGEVEDYQLSVTSPPPAALETVTLGNGQTNPRQNFGRLRSLQRFSPTLRLSNNVINQSTTASETTNAPALATTTFTASLLPEEEDAPFGLTEVTNRKITGSQRRKFQ
ncbi:MAG: Calx-beta domain-containing protein [Planctomycetaceae bacterium]